MTAISRGTLVSAMLLLMYSGAFGAQVDIHCTNKVSDTSALNKGIGNSHSGDEIRIHSNCLIDGTITLVGDRTYEGDSRTGTVIRQVGGANLSAMLASDSWTSDSTTTVSRSESRISLLTVTTQPTLARTLWSFARGWR